MINRITKFERQIDGIGDVIQASDVNKIQEGLNVLETENIIDKDSAFLTKSLFVLENNLFVNSMFVDEVQHEQYINWALSRNIEFNHEELNISCDLTQFTYLKHGLLLTEDITGKDGKGTLNDFLLSVDVIIPLGSKIDFFISTDFGDFPIAAKKDIPVHIDRIFTTFQLKAKIYPNAAGFTPKINSYSVTFFDLLVDKQYGMINPDLSRFSSTGLGLTTLIRDRALKDKLVQVVTPDGITELNYEAEGRLSYVDTLEGTTSSRTELNYGEYFSSRNIIEEKILSINTRDIETVDMVENPFIDEIDGDE